MKEHKNYFITELENKKTVLVKVLNEYEEKKDAKRDLFKLAAGEKEEKDLLKEYSKKDPIN